MSITAQEAASSGSAIPVPPDQSMPEPEIWETARRRLGWTIDFAASQIGVSPDHLVHFETGVRTPTEEVLERLGDVYGLRSDAVEARKWSKRIPPRFDAETKTLWIGWLAVHINGGDNEATLIAIGAALRTMRSLAEDEPVHLRESEWGIFAPLFDLDDPALASRLMFHFRLPASEVMALVDYFNEVQAQR